MLVVIIRVIRTNGKYKKSQEGDGISGFEGVNQASNRPISGHISTVSLVRVGQWVVFLTYRCVLVSV